MGNPWFIKRDECPACASGNCKTIYQAEYDKPPIKDYLTAFYLPQGVVEFEYLEGATYMLVECSSCGMIFQKYIPNEFLMAKLYDQWIDSQKAFSSNRYGKGLGYYAGYAQEIMQLIAYFGENPSALSFLDFGMGWGNWALMAKAFGCDSVGLELSKERIENAKLNAIKVIAWDEITRHRFDFINTEQVFEHIPEPLQTLRYLKSSLKKDGMIKISVPSANDINRRLKIMDWQAQKGARNCLNAVAPLEHINCFRRTSLVVMANKAGMEEVIIPIKLQYRYSTDWSSAGKIVRNILRPIYRNILEKQNYLFFRNIQ
ncbi:MAG: Methyltransferase domain protein [Bacteroidetes bacterium ADurb.Bin174]|mgnify:CR=1 FL=1|nr:MAG: Methyltransferase domain protein [Bacteroidetes bacterium ADurb.Bin174]